MSRLSQEVDVTQLLSMRESGMTNKDIADSLGISRQTVLNYIGKQPKGVRAAPGTYSHQPSHYVIGKPGESKEEPHEACLTVIGKVVHLEGKVFKYSIYPNTENIDIGSTSVSFEDLPQFIKELQAIERNLDKCEKRLEMW